MMLLLTALVAVPAYAVDSGEIVIASLKGEVHVTIRGEPRAVRAGTVLELPASVRTGRDGAIELRQGATSVRVGPDTLLDFPALEKRGAPIDVIQQPRGNAFYDVGKRQGRKLRVETPYLVGVIKGTQFSVAANDESTTISLFEGLLEIRATDDSAVIDLKAGEIASRRRGEKTINVVKMDAAKSPPTSARPSGNSGGGNPNLPGSEEARPAVRTVVGTTVDTVGHSTSTVGTSVSTGADIRTPVAVVTADTSVDANAGGASATAAGNLNVGNAVETAANVNLNAGASGVDAAANVTAGVGNAVDTTASAAVNLGPGAASVDVSTSTQVDAGPVGVSVETTTSVDVGTSGAAVDVATSTNVDAGPVSAGVDTSASVDLGAAGAAVDVATSTAVDAGPVAVDVDTGAAVDVDPRGASTDLGVATAVDVGPASVDVDTSTSVDVDTSGVTASVDAGAALGVLETPVDVPVTVSTGVDLSTGTVDLGLSVAGADLDLGVDLGLDGSDPATDTDSSPTGNSPMDSATDTGNTGTTDLGGLLDSLLRRPGRR